jgi:hypothetical protein
MDVGQQVKQRVMMLESGPRSHLADLSPVFLRCARVSES